MSKNEFFPSLPLRDIVVFPGMIIPLFVGRDKSIKALNEVMKTNKKIILVTQKDAEIDDPSKENLYSFGCESKILQLLKLPDGTVKALVEGLDRVKIIMLSWGPHRRTSFLQLRVRPTLYNPRQSCCNE